METKGEVCKSCSEPIVDFFVAALDSKFHETCFHCHGGCNKDFQEPKFFEGPGKMPFCPECFAASEGRVCKRCGAGVPSPIKALDAFWHDRCFTCDLCHQVMLCFADHLYPVLLIFLGLLNRKLLARLLPEMGCPSTAPALISNHHLLPSMLPRRL